MLNLNDYDVVIVGCGLTGSVISNFLAQSGKKIAIIEKRSHIAGNLYDKVNEEGIVVQYYGPHSFHTNSKRVYDFITSKIEVSKFILRCQVKMLGQFTPSPFNFKTVDQYFDSDTGDQIKKAINDVYPGAYSKTIVELLESNNEYIKLFAKFLYEHDYSLYTAKQWGISPEKIDKLVLKRVPVLFNYDEQYFNDKYQFMPVKGFTHFISKLLDHSHIDVYLDTDFFDYFEVKDNKIFYLDSRYNGTVIYTGSLDRLFNYRYGHLPYRSLRFEYKEYEQKKYQPAPVVAYPEAEGYTRITEYTQLPVQNVGNKTIVAYEYPLPESKTNEPYYPILTKESELLCDKYTELAGNVENLYLAGRLAKFKYYNMDQAIEAALEFCDSFIEN